jgi:hypothetical protein
MLTKIQSYFTKPPEKSDFNQGLLFSLIFTVLAFDICASLLLDQKIDSAFFNVVTIATMALNPLAFFFPWTRGVTIYLRILALVTLPLYLCLFIKLLVTH